MEVNISHFIKTKVSDDFIAKLNVKVFDFNSVYDLVYICQAFDFELVLLNVDCSVENLAVNAFYVIF